MTATPPPIVSGRSFLPEAPLTWRNRMPAAANRLRSSSSRESSVARHSSKARFPVEPEAKPCQLLAAKPQRPEPQFAWLPHFSRPKKDVARVPGFPLPKFPAEDGEADRPKHDKAQNHRKNFHELPRLPRRASTPRHSTELAHRARLIGHSGVGTHLFASSSRLHSPLRLRRAIGVAALRGPPDICSDFPLSTFEKRKFLSYPGSSVRLTRRLPRPFRQV